MAEIIILRIEPQLIFSLETNDFNIVDVSEPHNNGTYSYAEIEALELNEERTNWIYSIFTLIADFFLSFVGFDTGAGGKYNDKANLIIKFSSRTLKIWLIKADFTKAQKLTELIDGKIKPTHNNSYRQ